MSDSTPVVGTYNPAHLATRDRIRSLIADTGPTYFIADVTLDAYIAEITDWRIAAANAADQMASIYSRRINSVGAGGEITVSWGSRATDLRTLASTLRKQAALDAAASIPVTYTRSTALVRDSDVLLGEYRSDERDEWRGWY